MRGVNEIVRWIRERTEGTTRPDTVIMSAPVAVAIDRLRVRWGHMPWTEEGKRYAARRRRMKRKGKKGYA